MDAYLLREMYHEFDCDGVHNFDCYNGLSENMSLHELRKKKRKRKDNK